MDFPVVTSNTTGLPGFFLRERDLRLGVGRPGDCPSFVTSTSRSLHWTSVSFSVLSSPNIRL